MECFVPITADSFLPASYLVGVDVEQLDDVGVSLTLPQSSDLPLSVCLHSIIRKLLRVLEDEYKLLLQHPASTDLRLTILTAYSWPVCLCLHFLQTEKLPSPSGGP